MKKYRLFLHLLIASISLLMPAISKATTADDVLSVVKNSEIAINSGDIEKSRLFYTNDARIYTPYLKKEVELKDFISAVSAQNSKMYRNRFEIRDLAIVQLTESEATVMKSFTLIISNQDSRGPRYFNATTEYKLRNEAGCWKIYYQKTQ